MLASQPIIRKANLLTNNLNNNNNDNNSINSDSINQSIKNLTRYKNNNLQTSNLTN